jgi:superfamily II DNA or RNA helicase
MALTNGLWFNPRSLEQQADSGAWSRGLALFRKQQVLSLDIDPEGGHWVLLGEVQGSQREPYEVSAELGISPTGQLLFWESDCECPVGADCKHGVALMLKAAHQGLRILAASDTDPFAIAPAAPTPEEIEARRQDTLARAADIARIEAETKLLQWLSDIDVAQGQVPLFSAALSQANADRPDRPDQYVYLLRVINPQSPKPQLLLEVVISYPKASEGWARPKKVNTAPYAGQAIYDNATAQDRELLDLIAAMPGRGQLRHYGHSFSSEALLKGRIGATALELAAQTGRLFQTNPRGDVETPVQWGPPQALHWTWQEVPSSQGGEPSWVLRAKLSDAQTTLCLNHPPLYLNMHTSQCGLVEAQGISNAQLEALLKAPPLKAAALQKFQAELMQRLGPLPLPPVLQALKCLTGVVPTAHLHLSPCPPAEVFYIGLLQAQLRFDYAGHRGWWAGQGAAVRVDDAQGQYLLQRDTEAEFDFITRLMELGLRSAEGGHFGIPGDLPQSDWLHWAQTDYAALREAGFVVTAEPQLDDYVTVADTLQVDLQPQGEDEASSPWFDLSLGMEINGQRHNILPWLPELIASAHSAELDPETGLPDIAPFVFLHKPDGPGFIRLPTDALKPWLAALLELVGEKGVDFDADSLRLSRLDALRATAALGEGAVWEGAQHLREMVQRLSGRAEMPVVPVPAGMNATLRPYQQQGLNWLQFLRENHLGGILADDMGLGKTLQTLAHIQVEKDAGRLTHPALIIAPVSLMGNWRKETERFCPGLRALVIHGADRHQVADSMAAHDIVIAPYSLLQRDKERWLDAQWHIVVLDEAQNIKNASTHAAQVVGQLQTLHRLCLSGTPMENHLGEIWSLFHFLMPGFLGSQQRFRELFRTPIEKQGDPERLQQLRARITPFMLRRTKALVASELPPKVETVTRIELSGKQADLYETIRLGMEKSVREALNAKGLAKSQITILDALLKLRQVCCDPQLLKLPAAQKVKASAKLEHLMGMLPEMVAEGRRILLFSQFTSMLTLIEARLKAHGLAWTKLTGQSQNREAIIAQFTSGQVPIFLISLKAGGVGLNLPQADTVIHFDPWWNPAAEAQATDRAHRIGQTQTVFVYKLVAQGTIEERILALQERKAHLSESMYSGSTGRKQPLFTEDDLAELLKPLAD